MIRKYIVKGSLGEGVLEWGDELWRFTPRPGPWMTLETSEGEVFGFEIVQEIA